MNRRWNEFQILSEMEAFQKKVKDKHPRLKNRVVGRGGQANTAPYSKKPSLKRGKSAPPIVNMVGEALEEEIDDSVLDSFKIKSVLAPMLWDRQILKDEIRQKLIDIALEKNIPQQSTSKTQISYGINGNGIQCHNCKKYLGDNKWMDIHTERCEDISMWRYGFLKLDDGSLFCYFGCKSFASRVQLCRHLL